MTQTKLIWDATISDALNIHILKPKIIDLSISIAQLFALDDFGLAYEVMSDAEFLTLAGRRPMIQQETGPAHGVGANLMNWNRRNLTR